MSEPIETAETETELNDAASPEAEAPEAEAEKDNPNSREARYRLRAKDAEAALAAAQTRLDGLLRSEVERLASASLSHPSDVWTLSGNSTADYLTEDGSRVDAEKVAADVAAILAERPGLRKLSPAYDHTQGMGSNPGKSGPTWESMFNS